MNSLCHVEPIERMISPDELETTATASLVIWGMGCTNCATRVRNALLALRGVVQVEVSHLTATADVVFNPELLTLFDLADAVATAGNDDRHRYQMVAVLNPEETIPEENR